ncbi:MAG: hypothetical protein DRQ78_09425, partial [Epsilonproteobacteria bacterium]
MQKWFIALYIFMGSIFLMAGGDIVPVQKTAPASCKTDGVYIEESTKLMWQDQAYTDAEDGAYKRNYSAAKAGTFRHAKKYCSTLNYAGHNDWRMPTTSELSHVHKSQIRVFAQRRGSFFWTSTPATKNNYYVIATVDMNQY